MKTLTSLLVGIIFIFPLKAQQGFVVDHNHTDLSQIPDQWINAAKSNLKIRYFRRSHGSQIDLGGMTSLVRYSSLYQIKYAFSKTGADGSLFLSTQVSSEWNSLDFENDTWVQITRDYLDDAANADINVVMWAWSSNFYLFSATDYLNDMEMLIGEYGPGGSKIVSGERTTPVTFVFQTACGQRSSSRNQLVYLKNDTIRNHCINNNRILFDFNDLECYDPDGNYFGDGNPDGTYTSARRLNDDCAYISSNPGGSVYSDSRNWGIDWMNNNPGSELTQLAADNYCLSCAHSEGIAEGEIKDNSRLHCVLKGRAAWWLWARLAGWQSANVSISSITDLNEDNLNNAVINITLSEENFDDSNLSQTNFQINDVPSGTTIESVTYVNSQEATLALAFDGTDFDTDYNNFSVTISQTELQGSNDLTSNSLFIDGIDEGNPILIISSDIQLTEDNLDNAVIDLQLQNETFADGTLEIQSFSLNNEPAGSTIESISYQTTSTCQITLAFDGTDFDIDYDNFNIEIAGMELLSGNTLSSNELSIKAINELNIVTDEQLTENNLDGAIIDVELQNETFTDEILEIQNFSLNNEPEGCTIDSVSYQSDTTCQITLAYDGTDFDENISNFSLTISASELSGTVDLQANLLTINAAPSATLSSSLNLQESILDNVIITITLKNDTFQIDGRTDSQFVLYNAPAGLSISDTSFVSDTIANLTLAFDGTDFDADSTNFYVLIESGLLSGAADLLTNSITIFAENESSVEEQSDNVSFKIYPNPNNGNFTLKFSGVNIHNFTIELIDLNGKVLLSKKYSSVSKKYLDFNFNNLKKGSYLLILNSKQNRFVKSLIIE